MAKRTAAYVRVSTEDQVDVSPHAQFRRCRDLAKLQGLGVVDLYADEGWSGKNLGRPEVARLLKDVEAGEIGAVLLWRLDRLSRDPEDLLMVARKFHQHGVRIISVAEGELDLSTAAGHLQVGIHAVVAGYYRQALIENTNSGQLEALEQGRWINRAPTGYSMVNKQLVPNDDAPLVQRAFRLRAEGMSVNEVATDVGLKYSTVCHLLNNRAYLGETGGKKGWFKGSHAPLVDEELFNAAHRAFTPGKRRSKDLLSGKVRCGLCQRVATVGYNDRNQAIYRCKHRGAGCQIPGRSAQGLQRAARFGISLLGSDAELRDAIAAQVASVPTDGQAKSAGRRRAIVATTRKSEKLLELYYAGEIDQKGFGEAYRALQARIEALRDEEADADARRASRAGAAADLARVVSFLESANFGELWDAATDKELRILVGELLDAIYIYPDQLAVQVVGAPPITVLPGEVGLRGSRPLVSETGLEPTRPFGHQPLKLARLPIPPLRRGITF